MVLFSFYVEVFVEKQFPSYSNRKCKKSPFSRTAAHIFVSPGDAPAAITLNVGMEKLELCGYPMVKKFRRYLYSF